MGSKKQSQAKRRHQEKKASTSPWRNRIVAHGQEAPDQILAHPSNWRIHPREQGDALEAVLDEVGWVKAVTVNRRTGFLVDGHLRVMRALARGIPTVPVDYVELSAEEERKILATLDPIAALAVADKEKLELVLAGVQTDQPALAAMLEQLRKSTGLALTNKATPEPQPERADELLEKWQVRLGELWTIGRHRLLCGDSTDLSSVKQILDGAKPSLMVTDPPYGVEYEPVWRQVAGLGGVKSPAPIRGDDRVDWSAAYKLFPGAIVYLWHAGVHVVKVARSLEEAGFVIRSQIVWVKSYMPISQGAYHWKHEPIFYAVRKGHAAGWYAVRKGEKAPWRGDRKQTTVWEVEPSKVSGLPSELERRTGHASQKPVQLYETPMLNHTKPGDVVYDPFVGSGTAFVAAERLGRVCVGLEIEPRWVAVTLERMAVMGLTPERMKP
jgi:DNA modification methylase